MQNRFAGVFQSKAAEGRGREEGDKEGRSRGEAEGWGRRGEKKSTSRLSATGGAGGGGGGGIGRRPASSGQARRDAESSRQSAADVVKSRSHYRSDVASLVGPLRQARE
ncbi:hypothetical protein GW17_00042099 [Ensete ventricosum]|nr:hypothetical protein GW17_00042099 [Ensete ventricosum]RZS19578.1 hypothetical protein BHM03_00051990 [Ensete ventricosum]